MNNVWVMLPVPVRALPVAVPLVIADDQLKRLPLTEEVGVKLSDCPEQIDCATAVPVFGGAILRTMESTADPVEEQDAVVARLVEAVR